MVLQDCTTLQNDLEKLSIWEQKWKMAFHPNKCNVLSITRNAVPVQVELCFLWCMGPIQNRHIQVMVELEICMPELQRGPIRHNGAEKKLQLKHKNSLFTLQTFHYNNY
jgi:hypothetical protein